MPQKASVSDIKFHFPQARPVLKDRQRLKIFILSIFKKEKIPLRSLQYVFCSDERLLEINQQYLQHDYYTDIISFSLAERNQPVEGEIYISLDRVKDNAKSLHQFNYTELHRVIFHGVLHLCGYKDSSPREITLMRKKENQYLNLYFK